MVQIRIEMMSVIVHLLNGEAYEVGLPDSATIHDVKCAIPDRYPWQIRLFPFEDSNGDSLDDSFPVSDKDSFRAFIDTTDTRVFYFEKGTNPFHAITQEGLLSRLSVYYLETGDCTTGATVREPTPQTEYYFDMKSLKEWPSTMIQDPLSAFLKRYTKGAYKGWVDGVPDRYQVYQTKRNQST